MELIQNYLKMIWQNNNFFFQFQVTEYQRRSSLAERLKVSASLIILLNNSGFPNIFMNYKEKYGTDCTLY